MRIFCERLILSLLQLLIFLFIPFAASSQSSDEMKKIFAQAESYFLYEEYELANQLYILLETPENLNIKYKIGTCYLNITDEKDKSIPYLEEAVKSATYNSKTESFKETRAPLDCYFSLAKAYMINNDFEKGLNTLENFKRISSETKGGMKNLKFVDQQIMACKNAIQYRENPVSITKKTLGNSFTEGSINENPAVSFDGSSIVYTERRGIVNAIFYSRKEMGNWQPPVEITSQLKAGEDCSSCSMNADGTKLFLYKTDNYDGAIYSSDLVNGTWTPIKKLNKNINTKFYESHASISYDGKKLYFTSNRDGGEGNLDIYVSSIDASGDWGPAVNLGKSVNTPFNEDTPFITENDSVLFFSSEGHSSMGGYDNYKSRRSDKSWETPVNLGYLINSADDDKFYQPVRNGQNAYYSMTTDYKKRDIFYIGTGGIDVNQQVEIRGMLTLEDTVISSVKDYPVYAVNKTKGDTVSISYPKQEGNYSFVLSPGEYKLVFTGTGYLTQAFDKAILKDSSSSVIDLDVRLLKDPEFNKVYDQIILTDIPQVESIDSSILVRNMNVNDIGDTNIEDTDVLYYTVQVIALHNPVDVSYFKYIANIVVLYNDNDKFYRYTTGHFATREEAYALRTELIRKGYPEEIFIKKISK